MNANHPLIFIVEDSLTLAALYSEYLTDEGYQLKHYALGLPVLADLETWLPQVIILDLELPDISGMEILKFINERHLPCTVLVVTAHG